MNCTHFETLVQDLARECLAEETVNAQAVEHAASCPGCARRLAAEKALTAIFRHAASEKEDAPPRIEAALTATDPNWRKRADAIMDPCCYGSPLQKARYHLGRALLDLRYRWSLLLMPRPMRRASLKAMRKIKRHENPAAEPKQLFGQPEEICDCEHDIV